jgi:hypothetical protein
MSKQGTACGLLMLALGAAALWPADAICAAEANALYQTVVPLRSATEADRVAAFGEALRVVAVRVSGARDAGTRSDVAAAAAKPARYVQQYSARANRTLKVGFDPRAIEQLVLEAGLPVWPAERPKTLVLLHVPSIAGGGRAVLVSEPSDERTQLEQAAETRGIPLVWPVNQVASGSAADPAKLRGLARSAGGSAATGVLIGVAQGGTVDWRFLPADGEEVARRGAAAEGAHLAADALARIYATASTRDLARQSIVVAGIEDLGAYAEVLAYFDSLSFVREVGVDEAYGDSLRLGVTMRGDRALLRRVVALGKVLDVPAVGADEGSAPDFVYSR